MTPSPSAVDRNSTLVKLERWNYLFWLYLVLTVGALLMMAPFFWMIITSLKPRAEILTYPPSFWVDNPTLTSFRELFRLIPMKRYILSSVIVAGSVTIAQ